MHGILWPRVQILQCFAEDDCGDAEMKIDYNTNMKL